MVSTATTGDQLLRQRILALSSVQMVRPVFARWASQPDLELYETATRLMSSSSAANPRDGLTIRQRIRNLPEGDYGDPYQRDYYVMLCLTIIYHALGVVLRPEGTSAEIEARELDAALEDFADIFNIESLVEYLRGRIAQSDSNESPEEVARKVGEELVIHETELNKALDDVARVNGWPLHR